MLELIDLSKEYKVNKKESFTALNKVNLTAKDGEILGVIGLSGAGKSTLVRCINLLEKPDGGKVVLDGIDLTKITKKELNEARKKISMIFQGFNLFEQRTALENVCFPLELVKMPKQQRILKAKELLKQVGLEDKENSYPSQLSGGQKQRVAIARALASNPKYLLCDEATSALDPEATESVLSILREINAKHKITIIIITHELSVATKICDRIAVVDKGVICECEQTRKLFLNPKSEQAKRLIRAQTFDFLREEE